MRKNIIVLIILFVIFNTCGCRNDKNTYIDITGNSGIGNYLSFELPEGLGLGEYKENLLDNCNGSFLVGDMTVTEHGEYALDAWKAIGGITVCENGGIELSFKNGKILSATGVIENHVGIAADGENIENDDLSAYLIEYEFDLFTAAELEEYQIQNNITLSRKDTVSRYWYVYLGNEGDSISYVVFLNADLYSKEEVIAFVKTIHLV